MIIRKTILSVLSASLFVCSANAVEAPATVTATPLDLAAKPNCPNYSLIPGYVYEWRTGSDGCRYPVFISKG